MEALSIPNSAHSSTVPNSSRSSFLISPSPSPSPRSRSPSPSFITTGTRSQRSHNPQLCLGSSSRSQQSPRHSPQKRKRHDLSPVDTTPSLTNSSLSRSDSSSTALSSGPFSSQASRVSGIPFHRNAGAPFYKATHNPNFCSSPHSKPSTDLNSGVWSGKPWDFQRSKTFHTTRDSSGEARCIGGGGMPGRTFDFPLAGLYRQNSEPPDMHYQQWRQRSRAASIDIPESPRSMVSRRMFELGLVDSYERSPSVQSKSSGVTSLDDYYTTVRTPSFDILGERDVAPPSILSSESDGFGKKFMRYNLKALYSPCPTLVKEPVMESIFENPKLWPATNSNLPTLQAFGPSGTKRRRSISPPLAPRRVTEMSPPLTDGNSLPRSQVPISKLTGVPLSAFPAPPSSPSSPSKARPHSPQTRSSSPPLPTPSNPNPLTWHATEITGHMIDPSGDDDGTGMNGVGFRPTKQEEEQRRLKRRRQIDNWKRREEGERRAQRSDRRDARRGGMVESLGMDGTDEGNGRRVRFMS